MSHKTNPRRRPATMADVERAKQEAFKEAVSYAIAIIFTALKDKGNMNNEELLRIWDAVNELSDSITRGYVSISDLRHVLLVEYGIEA